MSSGVELRDDRIDSEVGAALANALLDDLEVRYGGRDPFHPDADELTPPGGAFLVGWVDGEPIACGGILHHAAGIAEVKRMYVAADARRSGVARVLLQGLEERARALGYRSIRLETGAEQPEAIALYESSGYHSIPAYGHYRESSRNRCYEKDLSPPPAPAQPE